MLKMCIIAWMDIPYKMNLETDIELMLMSEARIFDDCYRENVCLFYVKSVT